jgi:VIT1/CCC1 family predicted Fe2+/Mn2+ transporter
MFGAFHLGGIIPILPHFIKDGFISSSAAIGKTIGLSLTSSFIVGAIKSRMAKKNWVRGRIEMAGLGTGVALVDCGIGSELNKVGLERIQVIFHELIL